MKRRVYREITNDRGVEMRVYARDNHAAYILRSATAKDLYFEYKVRYNRWPTGRWYNRHLRFELIGIFNTGGKIL